MAVNRNGNEIFLGIKKLNLQIKKYSAIVILEKISERL